MPWRKLPWKLGTLASASRIGAFFDPGEPRPHIYQNFPFSTFSYPARQAPIGFILKLFLPRAQGPGDRVRVSICSAPTGLRIRLDRCSVGCHPRLFTLNPSGIPARVHARDLEQTITRNAAEVLEA